MPRISKSVKEGKRIISYYQIGILFPDGKKIVKPKCNLEDLFTTYFIKLDNYLKSGLTAEEILEKYKNTFKEKGIKIGINYIDTWGHKWTGKCAWPRKEKFVDFLNKQLNK